jgi:hypothetical protein
MLTLRALEAQTRTIDIVETALPVERIPLLIGNQQESSRLSLPNNKRFYSQSNIVKVSHTRERTYKWMLPSSGI